MSPDKARIIWKMIQEAGDFNQYKYLNKKT